MAYADLIGRKLNVLEGQGLTKFRQVFRNEQVKIYEVNL